MTKSTAFRFYTFWYLHLMLKNLITELQCLCYNGGLCLFVGLAFVFVFFFIDVMTAAENICSFRVVKFKPVFVYDFFNCFSSYSNKDFIIYHVWFSPFLSFPISILLCLSISLICIVFLFSHFFIDFSASYLYQL